jgi:hypothetical protein
MDSLERAKQRIAEVIAGSSVPEDPRHSRNTLEWLLELDPGADAALQIAALGHDIDRAVAERKVRRADFADFDAFKTAHARNSAEIVLELLEACGVDDAALVREVHRLVCRHEVGGDPRSDLLKDADSLSFFDVNLPLYFARNGWEETRRRCVWGYRRLSERMKPVVPRLAYPDPELRRLVNESIAEAEMRRQRGSGAGSESFAR